MSLRTEFIFVCFILLSVFGLMNNAYSNDGDWDESSYQEDIPPATETEFVPKLDPSLPDIKAREQVKNERPTISVTVNPTNPVIGGEPVYDSSGKKCRVVITAHGWDKEDGNKLKYRFKAAGAEIGDKGGNWDWDNDVRIDLEKEGFSERGLMGLITVEAMDSFGEKSDPILVQVKVNNPNYPGYDEEDKSVLIFDQAETQRRLDEEQKSKSGESKSTEYKSPSQKNTDLLNCLCRCSKPEKSNFDCRYDLNPKTYNQGGSPSCADLKNGPCMCEADGGCFRTFPPTSGECYESCVEIYGRDDVEQALMRELTRLSLATDEKSPSSSSDESIARVEGSYATESEPNDLIGDADQMEFASPVGVQGKITPANDVDFYKFHVDSAGMLEVKMDQVPDEMKTRIDFYGKNLNWITRKDASNAGDVLNWVVDLSGPSAHYIAISDLDRKARSDLYSFTATFRPALDSYEPNNQVGDSTDMELGQTITGYICPVDDVDFYKIQVDAPAILEVKLEEVPSDMKARIDLYGKNNNWITRIDASNAGDAITLESDLAGPGIYYIAISDLDRKAHDQEYQLMAAIRSG